jgi:hypothetical protein
LKHQNKKLLACCKSCETFLVTGKIDEAEGTSVAVEIENLLSAATIEQQLHIIKEVVNT